VCGGGAARLPHGGALTGAWEMAGEMWWGSPARGRRRDTTAASGGTASVDVGGTAASYGAG
jgi:hypothetical protein